MKTVREIELEAELAAIKKSKMSEKEAAREARLRSEQFAKEARLQHINELKKPIEIRIDAFVEELTGLLSKYPEIRVLGDYYGEAYAVVGEGELYCERRLPSSNLGVGG